jgi:death-on-curing protein
LRHLALVEVLELHQRILEQTGGLAGVRDLGALKSALAQPGMTFGGADLYPDLPAKAAALGFSLIQNHPFVDGNKRTGHAALEALLLLNGFELAASVDEAEATVIAIATGQVNREGLTEWLRARMKPVR